ncbi:MAG TPA: hypothetical protein VK752_05240 [Bryobacteraceae bacterium]|nr:hypothetical protein [Bryobacteraceae bacterium]
MSPAILRFWPRCRYCSKQRPPEEMLPMGMCARCLEWHMHALDLLAGKIPPGCQECGLSFSVLERAAADADVRLYVVPRDGIYQVLCRRCCDVYVRSRRDLYKGTPFGFQQNL